MLGISDIIILSLVEGITEFLPISSTGHLIIANYFLGLTSSHFLTTFEIFIQLGAIMAVVYLYGPKLMVSKNLSLKVLTAFVPTAVIGFLLYPLIKNVLLASDSLVVWALLLGGVVIIAFEWWYSPKTGQALSPVENITWKQAFLVGLGQAVAVIPGVSRSGATIITGLAVGLPRQAIVEFSFLLAIPTMLGATGYDLFKTNVLTFSALQYQSLILGFIGSFLVSLVVVRWFLQYIQHHNFTIFGLYRVVLALVLWLVIF